MPDLEARWRALLEHDRSGLREVDAAHGFRRYYGTDDQRRLQLVVLTNEEPAKPLISDAVEVMVGKRGGDELWTLALTLTDSDLAEVFLHLAINLVRRTDAASGPDDGLRLILLCLDEWRRVLNPPRPRHLSEEELRGLVAELWIAQHVLLLERPGADVVAGWLGPYGGAQDFGFGSTSYEVKSVRPHATAVKISSANQLNVQSGSLTMYVVTLADASADDPGVVSLVGLAEALTSACVQSGGSSHEVTQRLRILGVELTDPYYADRCFVANSVRGYEVVDGFPAIRGDDLPLGVDNVSYEISMSALAPFTVEAMPTRPPTS